MQNYSSYKIGKIIESHFNTINNNNEYQNMVEIILDYTKDDKLNYKYIFIGNKWKLELGEDDSLKIENVLNIDYSGLILH